MLEVVTVSVHGLGEGTNTDMKDLQALIRLQRTEGQGTARSDKRGKTRSGDSALEIAAVWVGHENT